MTDALEHFLDRLSKDTGYNRIYRPFGQPTGAQEEVVKKYVKGKVVHDLGAGRLALAAWLAHLGARKVIAIDEIHPRVDTPKGVKFVWESFCVYEAPIDTAFLSWPASWGPQGLIELVSRARIVIYLGSCIDGNACGDNDLYEHFLHRELLEYLPHRANSLQVMGKHLKRKRPPTGEEVGALCGKIIQFEAAEERAKKGHALSGICRR